jgi:hypothetical protein
VTHRPEQVPPPFEGMALAAVAPPDRVDLATPPSIVNRERALATLIGLQPVPRGFAVAGSGYIKDLTVPASILYGPGNRMAKDWRESDGRRPRAD